MTKHAFLSDFGFPNPKTAFYFRLPDQKRQNCLLFRYRVHGKLPFVLITTSKTEYMQKGSFESQKRRKGSFPKIDQSRLKMKNPFFFKKKIEKKREKKTVLDHHILRTHRKLHQSARDGYEKCPMDLTRDFIRSEKTSVPSPCLLFRYCYIVHPRNGHWEPLAASHLFGGSFTVKV